MADLAIEQGKEADDYNCSGQYNRAIEK